MYALAFDMSISDLEKYYGKPYNNAYFEIATILYKYGFYRENTVFFLVEAMHNPKQIEDAKKKFLALVKKYEIDIVSIGNGTASRETETFVANIIKENKS